ncbi:probable lysophospholipase BODYGUARD 4 isoform X2 [Hevea brasiliensis]|uniref:probable lysophospholipase BODYGUARD 4 isoform X2 n=1 Tax=Hevea brasiliensis TaxID=3981 RepID=UPI0025E459D3|nr:probable lysophospholipase BODYGUARD 4 isoform X2 [Hevea brasiliensis]
MFPSSLVGKWTTKSAATVISATSFIVFLIFDFLEVIFCIIYRYLDEFFEGKAYRCYCGDRGELQGSVGDDRESELSETLYGRNNVFRQMRFLGFARKWENRKKAFGGGGGITVWSDCGCESCVSWMKDGGGQNLHVVVKEPSTGDPTKTVFPNLSEPVKRNYRLFAVDLLGFGRSPKPKDCFYTLTDHLEMIEKSVIKPFELKSFHLVAHSMGCTISLALAAKYSNCVKSIVLTAPPYIPSSKEGASLTALEKLAGKRLWPPLIFGSSFMSWYEHLGRCVCLLVCRNHRIWEKILKLLTWRRDLHFMIMDLTRHTHHSAWHTMHNVICGGAKFLDENLDRLMKSGVKFCVIHGDCDNVVPLECSESIKSKVPNAEINIISNADHCSVIMGREKDFTRNLEHIWASFADTELFL